MHTFHSHHIQWSAQRSVNYSTSPVHRQVLAVSLHLATAKHGEKHGHKKASSVKPTKTPKTTGSIVEQFRGLPPDDLAFIEQLDAQFQLHGEKVKIKVERENATKQAAGGKNSKRTIDGSLR